jgi:DNA-binding MarR family transcriptional regulator
MPRGRFLQGHMAYRLTQAAHSLSARFVALLRERDLSVAQWRVLASLHDLGSASVQDLMQHTLYQQATLSKLVQRMQLAGWLVSRVDPADKRVRQIRLTTAGQQLTTLLVRQARRLEADRLAGLSVQERDQLSVLVAKLIDYRDGPPTA